MKKRIMLCLFLMIGLSTIAQIKFEKGYFIQQDGQKIECLIKNETWDINKGIFRYKLSENENAIEKELGEINEISIYNTLKYKRYNVDIDISISTINQLSADRNPKFRKAPLLLKVLLEGKASLFQYKENKIVRFFYSTSATNVPKQLVYKKYTNSQGSLKYNEQYKQQLNLNLKCENGKSLTRISYTKGSLVKYFTEYNNCSGNESTVYNEFANQKGFNFKIKVGASNSKFNLSREATPASGIFSFDLDYPSSFSPVFGFELEYFFPSKKNNLSIYIDPKFRSYKGTGSADIGTNGTSVVNTTIDVDIKSLEIPINLRYYINFSDNSSLSLNAGINFENHLNSTITYGSNQPSFDFGGASLIAGFGYHVNKLNFELKFSNRNVIKAPSEFNGKNPMIDLLFAYTLF